MGYVTGGGASGSGAVSTVAGRTGDVVLAESDVTSLVSDLALKAPLASPTLTGTPTLPSGTIATTQSVGDSSTKLSTTAFVAANASPLAGAISGPSKIVRRSGDSSSLTSQGVPQADDTLLWTIGASDVWFFEAFLLFNAANATMDIKIGWTVPASATMTWGAAGTQNSVVSGYGPSGTGATVLAMTTESQTASYGTLAGTNGVGLAGVVVGGGTGGTVTFKWSQNTSDAGALKLLANSFLRLARHA